MNFAEIAAFAAALCNFLITVLVLRCCNWREPATRANAAWGLSLTLWNVGSWQSLDLEQQEPIFWIKILHLGVIFMPVTLLHVSLVTAQVRSRKFLPGVYILHTFFAAMLLTDLYVADVHKYSFGNWMIPGPLFWAWVVSYGFITTFEVSMLWRTLRRSQGLQRTRLRFLLNAVLGLWVLGTNDLLPIFGFDKYPLLDIPFLPLANLAAIVYGVLVGYSALQHSLLDVHVTMGRISAHLVRFVFLFGIGLVLQLFIALTDPQSFRVGAMLANLAVLLVSAALASVLFPKLFGGSGMEKLERRILGDSFEYQDQVRSFIERMNWYADLPALLDELQTLLLRTFKLESYQIILRDESNLLFVVAREYPEKPTFVLKPNSPVFQYFEWGKGEYLSLSSSYVHIATSPLERGARDQMRVTEAEFCFPLAWQREPFGLLLVGKKVNGEPFTATDINLLVSLAKNMSLVANQIRLKTQILLTQELDLLGRMSRGMAHDLNNLLTPVSTLLQLATETGSYDEELLPTALRNISTMHSYIKESLFFSEHPHPDLRLDRLDIVVQQTLELARSNPRKPVEIVADHMDETLVEMNSVLMQRLLINLISNAIDASEPGMEVRIQMERLEKGDRSSDWVRIRVIDQGEGISRENLSRVQIPYFTTKDRGDENRGFGLGLAICRKIVTLHGGNLSIESQLRKGTTVMVDLPSRQAVAESTAPAPELTVAS